MPALPHRHGEFRNCWAFGPPLDTGRPRLVAFILGVNPGIHCDGGGVEVTFRATRLRKCYEEQAAAQRAWGDAVARAYARRIELLKACETLQAVAAFRHLRFHPLTGDRKGQYAVTLHDRWRLAFTIHGTPPSRVHVEEVSIHYGD